MWRGQKVSVCFPAYNEEANIFQAVESFLKTGFVDEVVVADNDSTDRTSELALRAGGKVVPEKNRGMGNAVRRALAEAEGDLVVLSEPDGTFVPQDIEKLLLYSEDFEFVLGTRTNRALIWGGANMRLFLRWGNWAVAKLLEFLHNGPSLTDVGCSYRLFRRDALRRILPHLTVGRSHCLPEQVIVALRLGIKVAEIPVNYKQRIGESKITGSFSRAIRVGLAMIRLILSRWVKPISGPPQL